MIQIPILLDHLDALVYVSDLETYELLYINEYGKKVWGDVTGKTCYHALQKDQNGPCLFCTNKLLITPSGKPGEPIIWEFQNTINGRWYQCRDSAIKWIDGRLVRLEIATDITSRKESEFRIEKLSHLKERLLGPLSLSDKLRDIIETSTTIFDIDLTCVWIFQDLNHQSESLSFLSQSANIPEQDDTHSLHLLMNSTGSIAQEMIPATISFSDESEGIRDKETIGSINQINHSKKIHYFLIDWAEKLGMHTSRPLPVTDGSGKSIGYMSFFRKKNITPEEQQLMSNLVHTTSQVIISGLASEALARTKEKYRILVENLPQGIFLKDHSLRYISCNNQFAEDLGSSIQNIIGRTDSELFPGPLASLSSELDQRLIQSKKTEEAIHEFIVNDKIKWIESVRTALTDSEGNFTGILGIMHDITDMKLAQEELQCLYNELEVRVEARTEELLHTQQAYLLANKKLNLMNSVTRHDMLNQLTALYGYIDFASEIVTDSKTKGYLEKAEQSARMIQEQILFTRIYQDIGVHAPLWQSVPQVVERVITGMKINKNLNISLSFGNYEIYADPLLEKVFYTLFENSERHGNGVRNIQLGDAFEEKSYIIWFEDDGTGIASSDKEHVFERGYGKNTGLGLFLAREILSITGLSIRESGIEGKGVRFEICIPQQAYRFSIESR